jgi:hypothetical protein
LDAGKGVFAQNYLQKDQIEQPAGQMKFKFLITLEILDRLQGFADRLKSQAMRVRGDPPNFGVNWDAKNCKGGG